MEGGLRKMKELDYRNIIGKTVKGTVDRQAIEDF